MSTSRVFFVQVGDSGPVKVGSSDDVPGSLASLQAGNPEELRLLAVVEGGDRLERHFHKALESYKIRGTWFEPTDEVMAAIYALPDVSRSLGLDPSSFTKAIGRRDRRAFESLGRAVMDSVKPHAYVVRIPGGPIRIASSWTVGYHLKVIREAVPFPLEVVSIVECSPTVVDEICAQLEEHRIHGHWFRPTVEVEMEVHFLPDTASADGVSPARFYGGREIRRFSEDYLEDSLSWLEPDLDHVYRRAVAPIATVTHLKSGALERYFHLSVLDAYKHVREDLERRRERVERVCFYRRALQRGEDDIGVWKQHVSTSPCDGECRRVL